VCTSCITFQGYSQLQKSKKLATANTSQNLKKNSKGQQKSQLTKKTRNTLTKNKKIRSQPLSPKSIK